jgi:hypothetical protein
MAGRLQVQHQGQWQALGSLPGGPLTFLLLQHQQVGACRQLEAGGRKEGQQESAAAAWKVQGLRASLLLPCRVWRSGDVVEVQVGLRYYWKPLPDSRPEYLGLKALMMGPWVMAGLTHDTQWLEISEEEEADLAALISEPDDHEELVSLQVRPPSLSLPLQSHSLNS